MSAKKKSVAPQSVTTSESETDSTFFLKLVFYVILGAVWLRFATPLEWGGSVLAGLPIGLFVGLAFASRERFQIDRKIEYAVLLIATILSYFLPTGIVL